MRHTSPSSEFIAEYVEECEECIGEATRGAVEPLAVVFRIHLIYNGFSVSPGTDTGSLQPPIPPLRVSLATAGEQGCSPVISSGFAAKHARAHCDSWGSCDTRLPVGTVAFHSASGLRDISGAGSGDTELRPPQPNSTGRTQSRE
ncbi:hypothetical protein JMUB6875_18410 [Nocardia sp. JMUB6875]